MHRKPTLALEHDTFPNPAELVYPSIGRKNDTISNGRMPRNQRTIHKNHIVSYLGIVTGMRVGKPIVVISNHSGFSFTSRTIDRNALSKNIVIANL